MMDLHELDEGGLPIHLPMAVNRDGNGPVNDDEAFRWVCWCMQKGCQVSTALRLAGEAGIRRFLAQGSLEGRIATALARRHKCLETAGPGSGPCKTDRERASLVVALLKDEARDTEED